MGAFPHIRYAAKSDIGRKRTNNEDAFGAFPSSGIFCVADGMGGGDDGEVASAATIKAVDRFTRECPIPETFTYPIEGIVSGIRNAVNSASGWIARRTRQKGLRGCGSTFACICFDAANPDTAIALHAGDSRLYRIRGRSMEQMTVDHSAAELIGAKNDEEVNPMFRGMILRAVGIQPSVELERTEVRLKARDRILICSDGLSRMVNDRKMLSIIRAGEDLEATADRLIAAANDAGGVDNITVELIEVGELPLPLPTSPLACAVGSSPGPGTESAQADCANVRKTEASEVTIDASTEDDFIPSTARDGDAESAEELNIPESDTEDDSTGEDQAPAAGAAVLSRPPFHPKMHAFVCRFAANRYAMAGLVLALISAWWAVSCVRSRTAVEAREKSAVEAKLHVKEQKDSFQTVEARRKEEQEQKDREAEKERIRAEIKTLAKQKELDEEAQKAVDRREREEEAAREKAEADALREKAAKAQEAERREELRKAEEQRKERERLEAEAARAEAERKEKEHRAREEAARLEQLHKAEEQRKERERLEAEAARAEAERKEKERQAREEAARLEQLRKAEEEKKSKEEAKERARRDSEARKAKEAKALAEKQKREREKKEREAKKKQDEAIRAFTAIIKDGTAAKFHEKVSALLQKSSVPANFLGKLSQAGDPGISRTDLIAGIVSLTKDIQQVAEELREYSSMTLENINVDLADQKNKEKREYLSRIKDDIMAFDREAGDFIGRDASEPETQMKGVRIIRSVPGWFDF